MNLREFGSKTNEIGAKISTSIGDMDTGTFFLILFLTPFAIALYFTIKEKLEKNDHSKY
jgi:hypothetical protein